MAQQRITPDKEAIKSDIGSGPYLARIVSHLDPTFMGSLEVSLLREQGNKPGDDSQTYVVKCASPFFGYTAYEYQGHNAASKSSTSNAYNDTQKSYGMWMVPPDVGVTVIVVFINGDAGQGYWIGCVPSRFTNNMVPGIAGSTVADVDSADKKKYNTKQPLPVAEINRRLNTDNDKSIDVEKIKKPVHPIADRFLEQGTLEDDVRGVTTSSARREAPSMVFGISTPGPADRRNGAKKALSGTTQSQTKSTIPVSRLGGTQFVMDDGDERYQRKKPASKGPVEYADVLKGEKGQPDIPYNEHVRIRTRTGHQILLHNSEDLIYIGNARGTTWIELTSNGKIDIYAQDSINVHTEADLNFRADRDINFEAGRNINLRTEKGRLHGDIKTNVELTVGGNTQITTTGTLDLNTEGYTKITSKGTWDLKCEGALKVQTDGTLDIKSGGASKYSSGGTLDIKSGGAWKNSAGGAFTVGASGIDMSGSAINLNSGSVPSAAAAEAATAAVKVEPLKLHENIVTDGTQEWASTKYQVKTKLESIMKRIPMHEPWALHENMAPTFLGPGSTDREKED
jgi:hypothetical protein